MEYTEEIQLTGEIKVNNHTKIVQQLQPKPRKKSTADMTSDQVEIAQYYDNEHKHYLAVGSNTTEAEDKVSENYLNMKGLTAIDGNTLNSKAFAEKFNKLIDAAKSGHPLYLKYIARLLWRLPNAETAEKLIAQFEERMDDATLLRLAIVVDNLVGKEHSAAGEFSAGALHSLHSTRDKITQNLVSGLTEPTFLPMRRILLVGIIKNINKVSMTEDLQQHDFIDEITLKHLIECLETFPKLSAERNNGPGSALMMPSRMTKTAQLIFQKYIETIGEKDDKIGCEIRCPTATDYGLVFKHWKETAKADSVLYIYSPDANSWKAFYAKFTSQLTAESSDPLIEEVTVDKASPYGKELEPLTDSKAFAAYDKRHIKNLFQRYSLFKSYKPSKILYHVTFSDRTTRRMWLDPEVWVGLFKSMAKMNVAGTIKKSQERFKENKAKLIYSPKKTLSSFVSNGSLHDSLVSLVGNILEIPLEKVKHLIPNTTYASVKTERAMQTKQELETRITSINVFDENTVIAKIMTQLNAYIESNGSIDKELARAMKHNVERIVTEKFKEALEITDREEATESLLAILNDYFDLSDPLFENNHFIELSAILKTQVIKQFNKVRDEDGFKKEALSILSALTGENYSTQLKKLKVTRDNFRAKKITEKGKAAFANDSKIRLLTSEVEKLTNPIFNSDIKIIEKFLETNNLKSLQKLRSAELEGIITSAFVANRHKLPVNDARLIIRCLKEKNFSYLNELSYATYHSVGKNLHQLEEVYSRFSDADFKSFFANLLLRNFEPYKKFESNKKAGQLFYDVFHVLFGFSKINDLTTGQKAITGLIAALIKTGWLNGYIKSELGKIGVTLNDLPNMVDGLNQLPDEYLVTTLKSIIYDLLDLPENVKKHLVDSFNHTGSEVCSILDSFFSSVDSLLFPLQKLAEIYSAELAQNNNLSKNKKILHEIKLELANWEKLKPLIENLLQSPNTIDAFLSACNNKKFTSAIYDFAKDFPDEANEPFIHLVIINAHLKNLSNEIVDPYIEQTTRLFEIALILLTDEAAKYINVPLEDRPKIIIDETADPMTRFHQHALRLATNEVFLDSSDNANDYASNLHDAGMFLVGFNTGAIDPDSDFYASLEVCCLEPESDHEREVNEQVRQPKKLHSTQQKTAVNWDKQIYLDSLEALFSTQGIPPPVRLIFGISLAVHAENYEQTAKKIILNFVKEYAEGNITSHIGEAFSKYGKMEPFSSSLLTAMKAGERETVSMHLDNLPHPCALSMMVATKFNPIVVAYMNYREEERPVPFEKILKKISEVNQKKITDIVNINNPYRKIFIEIINRCSDEIYLLLDAFGSPYILNKAEIEFKNFLVQKLSKHGINSVMMNKMADQSGVPRVTEPGHISKHLPKKKKKDSPNASPTVHHVHDNQNLFDEMLEGRVVMSIVINAFKEDKDSLVAKLTTEIQSFLLLENYSLKRERHLIKSLELLKKLREEKKPLALDVFDSLKAKLENKAITSPYAEKAEKITDIFGYAVKPQAVIEPDLDETQEEGHTFTH